MAKTSIMSATYKLAFCAPIAVKPEESDSRCLDVDEDMYSAVRGGPVARVVSRSPFDRRCAYVFTANEHVVLDLKCLRYFGGYKDVSGQSGIVDVGLAVKEQ